MSDLCSPVDKHYRPAACTAADMKHACHLDCVIRCSLVCFDAFCEPMTNVISGRLRARCVSCKYVGVFFIWGQPRCGCVCPYLPAKHLHNRKDPAWTKVWVCAQHWQTHVPFQVLQIIYTLNFFSSLFQWALNDFALTAYKRWPGQSETCSHCSHTFSTCQISRSVVCPSSYSWHTAGRFREN